MHLNKDSTHIKPAERFVVHCNYVNVEVLGTTFNVNSRQENVKVGLVTGKIRLTENTGNKAASALVLAPGDYIEYAAKKTAAKKKLAHPEKLVSWAKHQFVFTNATLGDMLKSLEDTYGYRVSYAKADMREMRIEGEINVAGVQELLETISASLHVSIYQNGKLIIVK